MGCVQKDKDKDVQPRSDTSYSSGENKRSIMLMDHLENPGGRYIPMSVPKCKSVYISVGPSVPNPPMFVQSVFFLPSLSFPLRRHCLLGWVPPKRAAHPSCTRCWSKGRQHHICRTRSKGSSTWGTIRSEHSSLLPQVGHCTPSPILGSATGSRVSHHTWLR